LEMQDALKQLDAVKSIQYCHNTEEASVNRKAKELGGRYFRRKSLPFRRMHVTLNSHKHLPMSTLTPKTPDSTTITKQTIVVTPTIDTEECVEVVSLPRKRRQMLEVEEDVF